MRKDITSDTPKSILRAIENLSNAVKNNMHDNGDYLKDGLIYCGKCNTKKQRVLVTPWGQSIVYCLCKCEIAERNKELEEERKKEEFRYIENLKIAGLRDRNITNFTFENAKNNTYIEKAKRYCNNWETIYKNNNGLLLWGDVGTGKTFVASCIANYLLQKKVTVMMTSLIKITNDLQGFNIANKNEYMDNLNKFKLLILDDLGAERQSDYALEQVFNVIDSRYKNEQPVIITTNLTLTELKNPTDQKYKRIYDRILEMCVPLKFEGTSQRLEKSKDKLEALRKILGG